MAGPETIADAQLTAYRRLLDNARAMLQAAREQRWDDLMVLDREREGCLAAVMTADKAPTRPENSAALAGMIREILDSDAQTGMLARAWQAETGQVLGSMDNERKLAGAYRSE